jgi:hypothetical protein
MAEQQLRVFEFVPPPPEQLLPVELQLVLAEQASQIDT